MDLDPLSVRLGPLNLKNPILTASGTCGYGVEFEDLLDLNAPGGLILKGLSLEPSRGNPPPRIAETAAGMLNAIGLENIGIENFLQDYLPELRDLNTALILNLYGTKPCEYRELVRVAADYERIDALEINISCPNVDEGGIQFGQDPELVEELISGVVKEARQPVIVKLSPNVTDIGEIARAARNGGADILSLINTITAMAVDVETRKPKLSNVVGGLSGPAIHPVAVRMVYEAGKSVDIPIIAIGGVRSLEDVLEFMIVGASAVQVGTMNFVKPDITEKLIEELEKYLKEKNISGVEQIVGTLKTK